jgi:beta-carotene hydroxylase
MTSTQDIAAMSEAELIRLEREIARRHIDKFPYLAVSWPFGNLAVWLSLWPLVFMGIIPLWIGFIIATLNLPTEPRSPTRYNCQARDGAALAEPTCRAPLYNTASSPISRRQTDPYGAS